MQAGQSQCFPYRTRHVGDLNVDRMAEIIEASISARKANGMNGELFYCHWMLSVHCFCDIIRPRGYHMVENV